MKSPILWIGGKFYMIKHLLKFIPKHNTYVEVFGGAAHLLFAKQPSIIEYYNDLDNNLVTFFRVIRDKDKFQEFYRLISLTPYSREEYHHSKKMLKDNAITDIERAYYFFTAIRQGFGGCINNGWGYSKNGKNNDVLSYLNYIKFLPEISVRLLKVYIENKDFRELIPLFNNKDVFLYLDPPYVHETRKQTNYYQHEMTNKDHEDLINLILKSDSKIMLSGYKNNLYSELEKNGWIRHDFNVYLYTNKTISKSRDQRIESIWVNYNENKLF